MSVSLIFFVWWRKEKRIKADLSLISSLLVSLVADPASVSLRGTALSFRSTCYSRSRPQLPGEWSGCRLEPFKRWIETASRVKRSFYHILSKVLAASALI